LLLVHCTDSDIESHDNAKTVRKWHVEENGWSDIGYHFLILKSGKIIPCRPIHRPGAHCPLVNKNSIAICLTGRHNFSIEQFKSLKLVVEELKIEFGLNDYDILGHGDLDKEKTCPNFNVHEVLAA